MHSIYYDELPDVSECISWFERYILGDDPLYPVLGNLANFYKVARNADSHKYELVWDAEENQIVLLDRQKKLPLQVYEFQQKYRYLIYLCEVGLRAILTAFSERERGPGSFEILKAYIDAFPTDFPPGEMAIVKPYDS